MCTFSGTSYLNMQILEKNDFSLRFLLMLGFKMLQYINTLKVVDQKCILILQFQILKKINFG